MARVLVVDDDLELKEIISRMLVAVGHHVLCADNGKEALKIIDRQSVDLVITDIIMPDMDGYELLIALRKRSDPPKIVAMSGGTSKQESGLLLHTALMMKADKILHKPLDYASFNEVILEALRIE